MSELEHLPAFVAACLLLSISPGPATMYIVGRTVAQGKRAGIRSVLGTSTGSLVHVLFAAAGLSAILAASALAFTVVKVLGALYLIYLGISALLRKSMPEAPELVRDEMAAYRQGLFTQVLNPKVAVFMMTFLPQFVSANASGPAPFLLLGAIFVALDTVWFLILVTGASWASRSIRENGKLMAAMQRWVGVVYVALGLNLLRARQSAS